MTKSRNRQFADLADSASIIDGSTASYTTAEETKLSGIAASANNYVHPNHSGEVTSSADGATVIASNVVDEDNLKVSNSPTNGYFLSAQSGNTGGLTWAAVPAGYANSDVDTHLNQSSASSGQYLQWNGSDYAWAAVSSVGGSTGVDFNDNVKARFGTGNDLELYHDGGNSYIKNSTGWINMPVGGAGVSIANSDFSDQIAKFVRDGTCELYYDGSKKLETVTGGVTVTGTCTASVFNATSDATLKTNIAPIENPLGILEKITGVSFDWKNNEGSAEGVLAQDVEQVLPNAVSTDEKGKKSVSYNNLVGVLIEAVKGQQEQINKLKERLNGLSD